MTQFLIAANTQVLPPLPRPSLAGMGERVGVRGQNRRELPSSVARHQPPFHLSVTPARWMSAAHIRMAEAVPSIVGSLVE